MYYTCIYSRAFLHPESSMLGHGPPFNPQPQFYCLSVVVMHFHHLCIIFLENILQTTVVCIHCKMCPLLSYCTLLAHCMYVIPYVLMVQQILFSLPLFLHPSLLSLSFSLPPSLTPSPSPPPPPFPPFFTPPPLLALVQAFCPSLKMEENSLWTC